MAKFNRNEISKERERKFGRRAFIASLRIGEEP